MKKKLNLTDSSTHPLVVLVKNWRKLSCLRNNVSMACSIEY